MRTSKQLPAEVIEILDDWRADQGSQNLSTRTIEDRAAAIGRYVEFSGEAPLAFTPRMMKRWIGRESLSAASKWTYSQHLRAYHAWLLRTKQRTDDPMEEVPKPRKPSNTPRPVENYQLENLLRYVNRIEGRARMMVLLAAYAGLRVHEIAKVSGRDYDPTTGTLVVLGKGDKEVVLDLHPAIIAEAANYPRQGWWFPGRPKTEHVDRHTVSADISRAMKGAGVDATPHALRHWYATALVENGEDIRMVQELMRHSSLTSTQIYTKVSRVRRAEAVRRLPLLGSPVEES